MCVSGRGSLLVRTGGGGVQAVVDEVDHPGEAVVDGCVDLEAAGGFPERASLGVFTIDERMAAARTWLDTEDRRMSRPRRNAGMDAFAGR
jgi:hypothetical protein